MHQSIPAPPNMVVLPAKFSTCTYILIGNRMHVKSLGIALGLANARPPGRAKFANAPPPGLTRRENACSSPGGLGVAGIDWCITVS